MRRAAALLSALLLLGSPAPGQVASPVPLSSPPTAEEAAAPAPDGLSGERVEPAERRAERRGETAREAQPPGRDFWYGILASVIASVLTALILQAIL